jgi:hypothetical protein
MKMYFDSINWNYLFFGLLLGGMAVSCVPPQTIAMAYLQPATQGGPGIHSFPNSKINKPKSVVFSEYQSTYEEIYPNVDLFKLEFATSIENIISSDRNLLKSNQKIDIEEIHFGKDFKSGTFIPFPSPLAIDFSKDYCLIKIQFKIVDENEHTKLSGILVTATSDGHDLFFRKKRVAAAISHAEQKFADLILGKLPASEMRDLTTFQHK